MKKLSEREGGMVDIACFRNDKRSLWLGSSWLKWFRLFSPLCHAYTFSGREGYLYYSSAYKCHFVADEDTEAFLPSLLSHLGCVYVTRGRVLNTLLADVIKITYRAYCWREFPVPSEQNSQTGFSNNVLWVDDAEGCTLTQKKPLAWLAKWHLILRLFFFFSF